MRFCLVRFQPCNFSFYKSVHNFVVNILLENVKYSQTISNEITSVPVAFVLETICKKQVKKLLPGRPENSDEKENKKSVTTSDQIIF